MAYHHRKVTERKFFEDFKIPNKVFKKGQFSCSITTRRFSNISLYIEGQSLNFGEMLEKVRRVSERKSKENKKQKGLKMAKRYYIESEHIINEWSEEEGEGDFVNKYSNSSIVTADSYEEAMKTYIKEVLNFEYKEKWLSLGLNSQNEVQFNTIVDEENNEDDNGSFISNNIMYIYELCEVKFF